MIYEFNGKAPKIDPSAYISESASIIGDVTIEADCYVGPGAVIRADWPGSPIRIGYGSAVEEGAILHVGGKDIMMDVGEKVTIAHGCIIHGNKLADNCNIGMGAIVSKGAVIGEYAIVAEGALVKQNQEIPPRVVVGGMPAKVLRELLDRDIEVWDKTKLWYIKLARQYTTPGMIKRLD